MATNPEFATGVKIFTKRVSAANTNRDLNPVGNAANSVELIGAGRAHAFRLDRILIRAVGATTVGNIRLYTYSAADGYAAWRAEIAVQAATPSATVLTWSWEEYDRIDPSRPLLLVPTDSKIVVATWNAEAFDLVAVGAEIIPDAA